MKRLIVLLSVMCMAFARPPAQTVTVEGVRLDVVQQAYSSYVPTVDGEAAEFISARWMGNVGLLAHDYLAGRHFKGLEIGDRVTVTYADGSRERFEIVRVERYRALEPMNVRGKFLDAGGRTWSATDLFVRVYGGLNRHLTLQTCDGLEYRLFFVGVIVQEDVRRCALGACME